MKPRSAIGLRHFRTFLEITRHDNLVKASEALNIAHSAVYRTLQELEYEFGTPLIERGHKSIVLTTAGKTLRDRATGALASFADAILAVRSAKMKQDELRVGTSPTAAGLLLPTAVARMLGETGLVRVQICSGNFRTLAAELRMGDLDMIVGRLPSHDMTGLFFEKLYEEEIVAVCRAGHPLAVSQPLALDSFGQFPLIVPPRDYPLRSSVEDYFRAEGVDPPTCIESTSDIFSRAYVARFDAVWFAPPGAIALDLEAGLMAKLPLHSNLFVRPVGVTTCDTHRVRQCGKLFVRILAEVSADLNRQRRPNSRAAANARADGPPRSIAE
ncbi:LysR substrate-binding domain-containing protein [Xanthobacteraceae bacterium Astr-EGSB]|uniref:LysR substrate-binding domain-containing protein n=1 Tax=Astrobacterium formosum TaxID=3069710 RepID=UPI0027B525F8|nr:LysR substrate-binding domain-containing protein [Xanthobacteraceae bacterium Astr-EGSB]